MAGIGLAGKYGHGKDYVAAALCACCDDGARVVRLALATAVRQCASVLLRGVPDGRGFATAADKDTPLPPIGARRRAQLARFVARRAGYAAADVAAAADAALAACRPATRGQLLQAVGTEFGRARLGADVWVDMLRPRIRAAAARGMRWVVTDVRFPNEVRLVVAERGVVLRVEAPALTPGTRDHAHVSETALDDAALPTLANDRTPAQDARIRATLSGAWADVVARVAALETRPSRFSARGVA